MNQTIEAEVYPLARGGNLLAICRVNWHGLQIKGIKLIQKKDGGKFMAMPNRQYKDKNGEEKYEDVCYWPGQETRMEIESKLISLYEQKINRQDSGY